MTQDDFFGGEHQWLGTMRKNWRKAIEGDGAICPCCDRKGKVYPIKLNKTYACAVAWIMVNGDAEGWVNVQKKGPRWMLAGKNYGMLTHWGLIESAGTRSGIWRATLKGRDFVRGLTTVPSAVFIYDDRVWGFEDKQTTFSECIKNRFDFDEMMNTRFDWSNVMGRFK